MKKFFLIIVFITVSFMFGGCSSHGTSIDTGVYGTYTYSECIYLNPLSSSTKDSQTVLNKDKYIYTLEEGTFKVYNEENELIEEYSDISYNNVDVFLDIDDVFSLMVPDFLHTVDSRYDIYSKGVRTDYIIFLKDSHIFLGRSRMMGGSKTIFTIWDIFSIK